jgi:hypothetical protein
VFTLETMLSSGNGRQISIDAGGAIAVLVQATARERGQGGQGLYSAVDANSKQNLASKAIKVRWDKARSTKK